MRPFRILHLSDIHIGDTYLKSEDIAYRIIADLETEEIKNIRCVLVTGDIFEGKCTNYDELIEEAAIFFEIIHKELNKSTEITKNDFLFIPGNHDIIRTDDVNEKWKKYDFFLKRFYGELPEFYDLDDHTLVKTYDDSRIVFVGFNSCGLEKESKINTDTIKNIEKITDDSFDNYNLNKKQLLELLKEQSNNQVYNDYGEITNAQILNMRRKLAKLTDYNIVAFFHHHFYLFPEIYNKFGDSSLIRNYTTVIQQMQQLGVNTVLHGHKHFDLERPLITDSYYDNANNIIDIFAGGSVGTKRERKHSFNVIDFYDKDNDIKLMQKKFVYNNDHLEPIIKKQIPPQSSYKNNTIKLLNTLKVNNPDLYVKYTEEIERINIAESDYTNMNVWLENIFVGFNEVFKFFERDSLCIFFLLISMNYRILKMKSHLGQEKINNTYFVILNNLLLSENENFNFDVKQYINLFDESDLSKIKENCDNLLSSIQDKKNKNYLAFSMIGIFITDMYLMLRYYADNFYNKYIKYKVNIKLDENQFHQHVPVNKIMIHSDADRRSAYIDLKCNSATAHKLSVLFIKEFELIISKYEDYFKIVGLKLYYLTPKIEKGDVQDALDNYNFEAYIPTLIPLLTGDNIYSQKEVFARELIQNSIDAIAVRESQSNNFDKTIYITIDKEPNGKRVFFRIKDFGTGMDRFKIERYFTSIGRSFYSGDEYRDLELSYKPISNFGIGFLSTFMICREIDVKTKYYLDEKEGLKLHIPNYDGCFFIEKDNNIDIGTEITLYIDKDISNGIEPNQIIEYICGVMRDIKYDIIISNKLTNETTKIYSHSIREKTNNKNVLFVPFRDDGTVCQGINIEDDVWSGKYIDKYPYGLMISLSNDMYVDSGEILNSGILLSEASIDDVWTQLFGKEMRYMHNPQFTFNFPANYLNIDVSREKMTEFTNVVDNRFFENLISEIYEQIKQLFQLSETNHLHIKTASLHNVICTMLDICRDTQQLKSTYSGLMNMRYMPYIRFNSETIEILLGRAKKSPKNSVCISNKNIKKIRTQFFDFLQQHNIKNEYESIMENSKVFNRFLPELHRFVDRRILHEEIQGEWYFSNYRNYHFYGHAKEFENYISKEYNIKNSKMLYTILVFCCMLNIKEISYYAPMNYILMLLLKDFDVSQIENTDCGISIKHEEFEEFIKKIKYN